MQSEIGKLFCRAFSLAVIAVSLVAFEASVNAATLTVKVVQSSNNAPLAGAQACFRNLDNTIHDSKVTDSQGNAVFNNAPQGTLRVTASKNGFVGFERMVIVEMVLREIGEDCDVPLDAAGPLLRQGV